MTEMQPAQVRDPIPSAQAGVYLAGWAFTLVELLVTVSIIGILAALCLSVLSSARGKARRTQCVSNLRQWGFAYLLYADENNDCLPRRGQGVQLLTRLDRGSDWFNALPPYFGQLPYSGLVAGGRKPKAREQSVFVCPVANDPGEQCFLCYGMNMNLSPWNLPQPTRLGSVRQAARVVVMGEGLGPYSSTYPSPKPYGVVARHTDTGNLLFLDGHVQSYRREYMGCGVGDPHRADVSWLTGTPSDANATNY
jgi:prepilin-type N-terminal cleavage/methylation domain-containing protein/prepilin-type processing-associated H-X9-DG protein